MNFKKLVLLVRDAWLVLGITLALLFFIEIILSFFFYYRDSKVKDYRIFADAYQNSDWEKDYYKEFHEPHNLQWFSYVYWRRKQVQGQYINVDHGGIRKTWSAISWPDRMASHPSIFFFGGSTVWGTGVRDDFTIPSSFAKKLASNGIDAQVINFGESGYVSTQEVITLIRELQKGNIPDLVIFYNGANDTFSAFQQHLAGIPQNEFNRVKEFNASIWPAISSHLSTIRFVKSLSSRLGTDNNFTDVRNNKALVKDVLDIYEKNIEIVNALAKHYSFKALFYWQPTIFEKKGLTKYEEKEREKRSYMQPFFDMTNKQLRERGKYEPGFHNLSLIFSDMPEPLFLDWCHLGERGNEYIAKHLADDALSIMSVE